MYLPFTWILAASTDWAPVTPESRRIAARVPDGSEDGATTIMAAWSSPCSGATVAVRLPVSRATGSVNDVRRGVPRIGTGDRETPAPDRPDAAGATAAGRDPVDRHRAGTPTPAPAPSRPIAAARAGSDSALSRTGSPLRRGHPGRFGGAAISASPRCPACRPHL